MMRVGVIWCFAAGCLAIPAQEPRWRTLYKAANQSARTNDYKSLQKTLQQLDPLMPGNPRNIYNAACAAAMLGDKAAALAGLQRIAAMGLVYGMAEDSDLTSLRGMPEFGAILADVEKNRRPVAHAEPITTLKEPDLLPEDLAYDPKTRRFLVSSVRKSKIITLDNALFAAAMWPVLALRIDPKRRIVWASTGWVPQCEQCAASDKDKTALLVFDLDSRKLQRKIDAPVPGLLGDMTMARDGTVYVSEGIYGAVFRVKPEMWTFERLDTAGEFPSPQNPALSPDEKTLYVADYLRGIAAIDLKTKIVRWLKPSPNVALAGIDGLYVYQDSFLAVQNGVNPARIVRFPLDLSRQEILEANTPGFGEPTHGTLVGDGFFFIANTGWNQYDGQGKKKPDSEPVISTVRRLALPARPM